MFHIVRSFANLRLVLSYISHNPFDSNQTITKYLFHTFHPNILLYLPTDSSDVDWIHWGLKGIVMAMNNIHTYSLPAGNGTYFDGEQKDRENKVFHRQNLWTEIRSQSGIWFSYSGRYSNCMVQVGEFVDEKHKKDHYHKSSPFYILCIKMNIDEYKTPNLGMMSQIEGKRNHRKWDKGESNSGKDKNRLWQL